MLVGQIKELKTAAALMVRELPELAAVGAAVHSRIASCGT